MVHVADRRIDTLLYIDGTLYHELYMYNILGAERCFERDIGWSK